ncbi:MAG TPA: hypothetical protein VHP58_02295 [Alphaproteobacteria bacterium]|nr:hypothetical protein [Alphaproteobacteria bacterium]
MSPLKLLLIAVALGGIYYYLPTILTAGLIPVVVCFAAVFYLGFMAGEAVEFCIDRYKVAKRL